MIVGVESNFVLELAFLRSEYDGFTSLLQLNAYFQAFDGKPWNEASILERGEKLFEVAKAIWPGPTAT